MSDNTVAVILAGVHDWGACPLNRACIKPLVPIANRPMMELVLLHLRDAGVSQAIICSNSLSASIRESIGDGSHLDMQVSYRDDTMPRGPAGCVKDATDEIDTDEVIVVESSIIPLFDLKEMIAAHRGGRAQLTVAAKTATGSDEVHSPAGVFVFSKSALDHVGPNGFQDIKESLIPALHRAGERVDLHRIKGQAPRLTGIASYFALNDWALKRASIGAWEADGYYAEGSAMVHVSAKVSCTAKMIGPVMIGPNVIVEDHAIIVGPTSVGECCTVGIGAVVSRSSLWARSVVEDGAQVDRSLVAEDAVVSCADRQFRVVYIADDAASEKNDAEYIDLSRMAAMSDELATQPDQLGSTPCSTDRLAG